MCVCVCVCVCFFFFLSGDAVHLRLEGVRFESPRITAFSDSFVVVFSSSVGECWDVISKMATKVSFQILFEGASMV
jgi:hypothetical protein